jgi:hypothetical protein
MKTMRKILENLGLVMIGAALLIAIGGLFYLDYSAYRQRFPQAAGWTYLFQGKQMNCPCPSRTCEIKNPGVNLTPK